MKTAFLLLALLMLTGCAASAPPKIQPAPAKPKPPDKRVILAPELSGVLRVLNLRTETGSDGIFKFQADVQNLGPKARTFLYQIDWLDRDGASLGILGEELPWTLMRQETASLTVTAPTRMAKDFRLKFRARAP